MGRRWTGSTGSVARESRRRGVGRRLAVAVAASGAVGAIAMPATASACQNGMCTGQPLQGLPALFDPVKVTDALSIVPSDGGGAPLTVTDTIAVSLDGGGVCLSLTNAPIGGCTSSPPS